MLWLVDFGRARITDQVEMFPAGAEPEDLLQPGAAVRPGAAGVLPVRPVGGGRAYIPAFCDVFMVEGNASMYLARPAWPRW